MKKMKLLINLFIVSIAVFFNITSYAKGLTTTLPHAKQSAPFLMLNVDSNNFLVSIDNGATWALQSTHVGATFNNVIWADNQYLAAGQMLDHSCLAASPDGVTWTENFPSAPRGEYLRKAVWYQNQYILFGDTKLLFTSPDGINWTQRSLPIDSQYQLTDIAKDNNQLIAISRARSGDGVILTSPDGITWTPVQSTMREMYSINWNGLMFVAVGSSGAILASRNGIDWTSQQGAPESTILRSVAWGNNQFVVVGLLGTAKGFKGVMLTSPDGVNWNTQAGWNDIELSDVVWSNNQFILVGISNINSNIFIYTSPDGNHWTQSTITTGTLTSFNPTIMRSFS